MRHGLLISSLVAGLAVGCSPSVSEPPVAKLERPTAVIEAPAPHAKQDTERVPTPGAEPQPPAPVRSAPIEISASGVGFVGGPQAGGGKWVTVKGQVILPEELFKAMPAKDPINAAAEPKCLVNGPLFKEDVIVNAKNRGIQNAVVWLRPANQQRNANLPDDAIYPDYAKGKVKPKDLSVDQPCCQFVPRITLAREGDKLEFKNSSPTINHNTKWSSNENGEFNVNIAPGQSYKLPNPLKYERTQIPFECNSHPWMKGQVRVFDHPYFALTDADGKFEIKNAPAGTFHIVYAHENGFHKGADGRFGWPIEIKDAGNGTMELKPLEYEFPKN